MKNEADAYREFVNLQMSTTEPVQDREL